jgi:hypothetical protein
MIRCGAVLLALMLAAVPAGSIEKDKKMPANAYLSEYNKTFLIQQTDRGWIVVNLPSRTKFGPVSPGPFSTPGIAKHVIDRVVEDSNR